MLIKRPPDIPASEITPRELYMKRRLFLKVGAAGLAAASPAATAFFGGDDSEAERVGPGPKPYADAPRHPASTSEEPTTYKDVTTYNNFYEFGTGKDDPARNSDAFEPRPWSVQVDGECHKPATVDLDALLRPHTLEERIYRLRCVEAWSMVIPWVGFPLGDLLARFEPTSAARFVEFTTLLDPEQMPGQRSRVLDWPYREGLRLDEAMHPLTILSVGLYGEVLPKQNGAPLRLVVPWKYGFKSIKSIVRIRFVREQPATAWNTSAPREYGFYSNVNPRVSHPRWSQARERRIGDGLLAPKRETLMFNGYGDQVARLYAGMDLTKHY